MVSNRVPAGSSCWMVSVDWSVTEPRKSVFSRVDAPIVPTKTTRAIARVKIGWRSPQPRTGRYPFCSLVTLLSSSVCSEGCSKSGFSARAAGPGPAVDSVVTVSGPGALGAAPTVVAAAIPGAAAAVHGAGAPAAPAAPATPGAPAPAGAVRPATPAGD